MCIAGKNFISNQQLKIIYLYEFIIIKILEYYEGT
nr:MAG TPA: hypothetical protein [Bacteriophage sp.]